MKQQLEDDKFFSKYQEVDFIAHSMGGLITKVMLSALNRPGEANRLQRVHTVLFMAVPSGGAPVASVATWLSSNPQFRNMSPQSSRAYLQSIDQAWESIDRGRTPDHPFPHFYVAYETERVHGIRVVPEIYNSERSDLDPIAFDYNHITIVKPTSPDGDVYKWAKARILSNTQ